MDYDYDVVIIGAGPVGGYTARLLCERGLSVLMVEEHNEVGRPFQCAGLVTPSAMDAVEAYDTVVEDVDGALIHGPSGTLVPVGREGELRTAGNDSTKPLSNKALRRVRISFSNLNQHLQMLSKMV